MTWTMKTIMTPRNQWGLNISSPSSLTMTQVDIFSYTITFFSILIILWSYCGPFSCPGPSYVISTAMQLLGVKWHISSRKCKPSLDRFQQGSREPWQIWDSCLLDKALPIPRTCALISRRSWCVAKSSPIPVYRKGMTKIDISPVTLTKLLSLCSLGHSLHPPYRKALWQEVDTSLSFEVFCHCYLPH